jgi:hypothetical protein
MAEIVRKTSLLILLVLGTAAIWWAPRPPMTDLAQHAGQIALMRDLLQGRSPWAHLVRLNFFTPYLSGYAVALALSFIFPIGVALKIALTAAFAGSGVAAAAIRRELGSARELDAYALVGFFGFAYSWGFVNFLFAAPVGLAFIWLCLRYSRVGSVALGWAVAGLGLLLVFSHGFIFLLAGAIAGGLVLVNAPSPKSFMVRCSAFLPSLAACVGLWFAIRRHDAALNWIHGPRFVTDSVPQHASVFMSGSFGDQHASWGLLSFVIFAIAPFLAGLRPKVTRERALIAGTIFAAVAFMPVMMFGTAFLYERLTLFLLPAYAWLFDSPSRQTGGWRPAASTFGLATICAIVLALHLAEAAQFSRESGDFDAVMAKAQPGQRALALVFDRDSHSIPNRDVYLHFPSWYQAEKHGFVDFNFAAFDIEIARFFRQDASLISAEFNWRPDLFDWRRDGGDRYRYFFVRRPGALPANFFAGAPQPPVLVAAKGTWSLYEEPSRTP